MSRFQRHALKTLFAENSRSSKPANGNEVWNLNLDQIESDTGRVLAKQIVSVEKLGPSTYPFEAGTVLYSKLRPYLNKVVVADDSGFATTELVPLRCNPEKLFPHYLAYFLRSSEFLQFANIVVAGAKMPRMVMGEFWDYKIPVPPLLEQRRIAAILDQADALRAKRREALALLDELQRGIFIEMFCSAESSSWPVVTIESIAEQEPGSIRTGPFGSQLLHSEFVDSGIAVLGIDNAVSNNFRWVERRFITDEKYRQLKRYTVRPGDVLITIMGTCGRCAVVPDDIPLAINTKHLCCISLNRDLCLPEFLHAYFLRHPVAQEYLLRTAKGAIMSGLNMGLIKSLPVALPPLERQRLFVSRCQAIQQLRSPHAAALTELDSLFVSLQHRAFRGDL